jgi:hypothetical protein
MNAMDIAIDVAGSLTPGLTGAIGSIKPTKYLASQVQFGGSP